MREYERCPNCGKKGMFETEDCFEKDATNRCKYCDMEFKRIERKGEIVWRGNVPKFRI